MADKFDPASLDKLSPEIRARVESALKATLERELASEAVPEAQAAHSRSRGAIFSRSRTAKAALEDIESVVAQNIHTMDDGSFDKFTKRLSSLRSLKGSE